MHALGELQDTALSVTELIPAGLGGCSNVQLVPSQVAARLPPTAVQAVAEGHETLLSPP